MTGDVLLVSRLLQLLDEAARPDRPTLAAGAAAAGAAAGGGGGGGGGAAAGAGAGVPGGDASASGLPGPEAETGTLPRLLIERITQLDPAVSLSVAAGAPPASSAATVNAAMLGLAGVDGVRTAAVTPLSSPLGTAAATPSDLTHVPIQRATMSVYVAVTNPAYPSQTLFDLAADGLLPAWRQALHEFAHVVSRSEGHTLEHSRILTELENTALELGMSLMPSHASCAENPYG